MSFLNQLKSQAKALQSDRVSNEHVVEERTAATEQAGKLVLFYLQDLARQLSVIEPAGPAFSLDGRTPWPAMKLIDFRVDARRKMLRNREVIDYIAMGWQVVPQIGGSVSGLVTVNFPTDMRRVEDRLAMGPVKHDRREIRKQDSSALVEVRYEYLTQTRANVTATLDHDNGMVHWRMLNTAGFEVVQTTWPAARVQQPLLDELAKRVVGQPNTFV
ncbi:hypothetical protein WG902_15790 [Ramlibacter sp. PS3R-8]|uniref:hypothetical protein n=1 Tax=Ramlibacter sp. PS3R-8 TaxID=3133437 RepID=UPI003098C7BD